MLIVPQISLYCSGHKDWPTAYIVLSTPSCLQISQSTGSRPSALLVTTMSGYGRK